MVCCCWILRGVETGAGLEQATGVGCSGVEGSHVWRPVAWARDASAMAHPPWSLLRCRSDLYDVHSSRLRKQWKDLGIPGGDELVCIQVPQGFPLIKPWRSPFGWLEHHADFVLPCHQRCGVDFPNRTLLVRSHFLKKNRTDYLFRA